MTDKPVGGDNFEFVSSFENLKETLLADKFSDRLDKTLGYWALPNDRRLPLAFLDRTIKDLLGTSFEELSATPGIGQKKIESLIQLLNRATDDNPPLVPLSGESKPERKIKAVRDDRPLAFDPAIVSEALWTEWQETVRQHGVGTQKLGRLAPTLQALPTVIWHTPLEFYVNRRVAEIRQLKTHGEKRVRAILEVFFILHEMFANGAECDHLSNDLIPKFIFPIENWVRSVLDRHDAPASKEVLERLAKPLVRQIEIDAGPGIANLAKGRLGLGSPVLSVRQQAKEMKVTRARVYQLLEECGAVMQVRWPEGRDLLSRLLIKSAAAVDTVDDVALLHQTVELFFPDKKTSGESGVG